MIIADIDDRVSKVLFSEVNGEYHNLYFKMLMRSESLMLSVFEKDFGKDYGRLFSFTGHLYVPDHDLTIFIRPSDLIERDIVGRMAFNQRWSIIGDMGIWADVTLYVNSYLGKVDVLEFEVLSAGRMEMGRLRRSVDDFIAKLEVGKREDESRES